MSFFPAIFVVNHQLVPWNMQYITYVIANSSIISSPSLIVIGFMSASNRCFRSPVGCSAIMTDNLLVMSVACAIILSIILAV